MIFQLIYLRLIEALWINTIFEYTVLVSINKKLICQFPVILFERGK